MVIVQPVNLRLVQAVRVKLLPVRLAVLGQGLSVWLTVYRVKHVISIQCNAPTLKMMLATQLVLVGIHQLHRANVLLAQT